MSNNDFKVAFIGLPSSGKSTIINSLIGKKLLESFEEGGGNSGDGGDDDSNIEKYAAYSYLIYKSNA